ncbi:MAG: tRNA pseudouridine(13) synthase TruD [Candidatus Woesearchaeota archaeon]
MAVIKENAQDFLVKEISNIKKIDDSGKGAHMLYLLKKQNCSTHEALYRIRKTLRLKNSEIGFSGSKDKKAITEQYITIKKRNGLNRNFDFGNFRLEFLGYCEKKLLLGDLIRNEFKIIARDLSEEEMKNIESSKSKSVLFPNYFGEQRFSKRNFEIGLFILRGEFENAIKSILKFSFEEATLNQFWEQKNLLKEKTKNIFEKKILERLIENKNDFVGALKNIPKELLMMYVHSVQSLIFNKALSMVIFENLNNTFTVSYNFGRFYFAEQEELLKIRNLKLPLVGFGMNENYEFKDVVEEILAEYKLNEEDFIIRKIPEISSAGSFRNAVERVENFNYSFFEENNKRNAILEFQLKKGCYATVFLKQILKN